MTKAVAKPRKRTPKPKLTPEQKAQKAAEKKHETEERKAREAKLKRRAKEKILASTRTYCAACGGKLAAAQSKKIALCRRCLSYCPRCGNKVNTVGHYDICLRCVAEVATLMLRYDAGHSPETVEMPWDKEPEPPKQVSLCECCGDEGEFEYHGRMLCTNNNGKELCDGCANPLRIPIGQGSPHNCPHDDLSIHRVQRLLEDDATDSGHLDHLSERVD